MKNVIVTRPGVPAKVHKKRWQDRWMDSVLATLSSEATMTDGGKTVPVSIMSVIHYDDAMDFDKCKRDGTVDLVERCDYCRIRVPHVNDGKCANCGAPLP